jgi:hypothetical protein
MDTTKTGQRRGIWTGWQHDHPPRNQLGSCHRYSDWHGQRVPLDGPDDHHSEHAQAQALNDAQQQAAREFRRDLAAAQLCRETVGESAIQWTAAGALVCVPRKGRAVAFKGAGL